MDGRELFSRSVTTVQEMRIKIGDTLGSVSLYYPIAEDFERISREFKEASKDFPDMKLEQLPQRVRVIITEDDCRRIAQLPMKETVKDLAELVNDRTSFPDFREFIMKKYPSASLTKSEYIDFDWILVFPERIDEDIYCIAVELGMVTYHRFSREEYRDFGYVIPGEVS